MNEKWGANVLDLRTACIRRHWLGPIDLLRVTYELKRETRYLLTTMLTGVDWLSSLNSNFSSGSRRNEGKKQEKGQKSRESSKHPGLWEMHCSRTRLYIRNISSRGSRRSVSEDYALDISQAHAAIRAQIGRLW